MIEKLSKENIDKRKNIEEEAWVTIDELKDKNKEELSVQIVKGMKDKAELQKVTSLHRQDNNKKDDMRR
jgi:hypothetical protein